MKKPRVIQIILIVLCHVLFFCLRQAEGGAANFDEYAEVGTLDYRVLVLEDKIERYEQSIKNCGSSKHFQF